MPFDLPPPPAPAAIAAPRPIGGDYAPRVFLLQAQPPQIPQVDVVVEVVGNLPLQAKLEDISRRLGRRQSTRSVNRIYPPTILELITLVNRNPEKPRDKAWNSIMALSMRYHADISRVTVEYCVEHCQHDPRTGALDPKRRMVSYSAPEDLVVAKVDKKLRDLKKYADR